MADSNYYHRTIEKNQLHSRELGTERPYWVYLPPGYNELLSYPVVFCQDGAEFLTFGRIATFTNKLVLEDNMEPPIIVGVEVDMPRRTEEYSPSGSRFGAYCRFFAEELLPEVENRYPVRKGADSRVVAGDSLGGTVSLHLALDRPGLFRNVISFSGAWFADTRERIGKETDLSWLELYAVVGLQETEVETQWGLVDFVGENRETKRILEEKKVNLTYRESPGRHVWGFWQKELPGALQHFLQN